MEWSGDYLHMFSVRIYNCMRRFAREVLHTDDDCWDIYSWYYARVWSVRKSNILVDSYSSISRIEDFSGFYENANELVYGSVDSDLRAFLGMIKFQVNPNERNDVVLQSNHMSDLYYKLCKYKDINDLAQEDEDIKNNYY